MQINVRRIPLPWLGTHVLYVEEYPFDEPFERRRRVLLSIEPPAADGTLRVRQFTRRSNRRISGALSEDDVESVEGCDILLKREGDAVPRRHARTQVPRTSERAEPLWIDYRVVIGEGLFWYRKRTLTMAGDELDEEIAGFPHVDFDEARLFTCGITWAPPKEKARAVTLDRLSSCTIAAGARASARRTAASCSSSCMAATGRCRTVANRWC